MSEQRSSEMDEPDMIEDSEHSDAGIGNKMNRAASVSQKKPAQNIQLAVVRKDELEIDKEGASINASMASARPELGDEFAQTKQISLVKDPLTKSAGAALLQEILEVETGLIDEIKKDDMQKTMNAGALEKAGILLDRSNQEITYDKLKEHIRKNHPTKSELDKTKVANDELKYFTMCDPLGELPIMRCCNKKASPLAQEIGIGASLFLMTTRALATLFIILTILNIPIFAFYYSGTQAAEQDGTSAAGATSFQDYFALLSLGNAGAGSQACNEASINDEKYSIQLQCGLGTSLGKIKEVGFAIDGKSSCADLYEAPDDMDAVFDQKFRSNALEVQYNDTEYATTFFKTVTVFDQDENAQAIFANETMEECQTRIMDENGLFLYDQTPFEIYYMCNCFGKSSCQIPLVSPYLKHHDGHYWDKNHNWDSNTYQWTGLEYSQETLDKIRNPDVRMIVFAKCDDLDMPNPFFKDQNLTKYDLGYIIVAIDILVILTMMLFIYLIEIGQKNFVTVFNENTITPEDFTLKVKGMPDELLYSGETDIQKSLRDETLRALLIEHFQEVIKDQVALQTKQTSKKSGDDFDDLSKVAEQTRARASPQLWEIADICFGKVDMDEIPAYRELSQYRTNYIKFNLEIQDSRTQEDKKVKLRQQMTEEEKKFTDKLKDYKEKKEKKEKETQGDGEPEVKYAFITFRNMEALNLVKEAYEVGCCNRRCTLCFGPLCCKKKDQALRKKHFFKKWLKVADACQPDNIIWSHLGYSSKHRNLMKAFNWLVAIIMIVASLLGMVYFKVQTDELKKQYKSDYICPLDSLTPEVKQMAYEDQILEQEDRVGIMNCYCSAFASKDYANILNVNFAEYTVDGQPEDPLFCKEWLINTAIQNGMVVGASVVVVCINVIACMIFEMMVKLERSHTVNEETITQFTKITIVQFINVAIIVICVNFDFLEDNLFGFIPIFNGEYVDFSPQWYANVGKTLCMTLMIQIVSPHASKLAFPVLKLFFRWGDRGYKSLLNIDGTKVNTKKYLQNELNTLYTGDQISGHYVYAQNYTYLWCVLMFSTGLPILYPFAVIFYIGLYWVYKFLLIKFYQKTTKFNYNLPIYTTGYIKIGVFFHVVIGGFMVTNQDIIPSRIDYSDLMDSAGESANESAQEYYDKSAAIVERFFKTEQGVLYFLFFLVLIVFLILKNTILRLVTYIFGLMYECCCKGEQEKTDRCPCVYKEYPVIDLLEIYDKALEELKKFEEMKEVDMKLIKEKRFPEEPKFNYQVSKATLESRKMQIERTLDDHLEDLYTAGNLYHFEGMTPHQKFKYLFGQGPQLEALQNKSKKSSKQWPFKESRLRMKGLTLSYDVFQSNDFKQLKDIHDIVTSESQKNYKLEQELVNNN